MTNLTSHKYSDLYSLILSKSQPLIYFRTRCLCPRRLLEKKPILYQLYNHPNNYKIIINKAKKYSVSINLENEILPLEIGKLSIEAGIIIYSQNFTSGKIEYIKKGGPPYRSNGVESLILEFYNNKDRLIYKDQDNPIEIKSSIDFLAELILED